MRSNKIRELIKAGKPTVGTRTTGVWPELVEVIGHTGMFDYVEFVAEYGDYDLHDLDNYARAAELFDMSCIIKPDQQTQGWVSQRAIGAGFQGVTFVDCRSPEDARECVRIVRPETPEDAGIHGVAPRRFALMGYGGGPEYVQALRDVVVILMIEKKPAVDRLEEILSVPGIDMVQWGPSDFSLSAGFMADKGNPAVRAAERKVFETALRMGIPPRAEIASVDQAKRFQDMGVRHFSLNMDIYILYQWWKSNGEALRKALGL
jgi:2-keto-3-deoxy-L-rhamnonate aldolase RhmA